jgi:hypothetical protein
VREAVRGARQGAVNPGWSWIATDFDRLPLDGSFALQVLPGGAALRGREEELKAEAARWREAAQALSDALAQGTVGARDAVVLRFLRTAPAEHLEVVRARLDQLNREAELLREGEALKEWRAKADELYRRIDIKTIDRLGHEVDRFVLQAPPAVSESVALHARRLRILHALDRKQWRLALHHFRPGDEARDETWRGLWLRAMVGTLFDHARLNRVQRPAESRRALQKVLQLQPGEPNALRMLDELKDR